MLGAPNDDAGNLSGVAQGRCRQALAEYRAAPGWAVLPTGGFGDHFNRSPEPHAHLTRRWLLGHGVPEPDVLEPVLSRFTLEDAALSKPVVERCSVRQLRVVTSDFHVARAELVFRRAFPGYRLTFSGSRTQLPRPELERLLEHEQIALARLSEGHNAL